MSWKDIFKELMASRIFRDKKDIGFNKKGKEYTGSETQFKAVSNKNQHRQLVCGIDFGTIFTKTVIGEGRVAYAMPWNNSSSNSNRYLQPCTYWVDMRGICTLSKTSGRQVRDLKMRLLNGDYSGEAQIEICVFITLILKEIRGYILNEKYEIYQDNYIDWLLNVGLPTDSYHDEALVDVYRKIISAAWNASTIDGEVTIDNVMNMLASKIKVDENVSVSDDAITLFPEFVAQLTGYVRSPLREDDLHMLVDIGAGTVDATIFNVFQVDDEEQFPIFAKSVKPYGTRFLVKHRITGKNIEENGELDEYSNIPDEERFSMLLGVTKDKLEKIDLAFKKKLIEQVKTILKYTKKNRYPGSRCWEKGIPTFLCGGGANCKFYCDIFLNKEGFSGFTLNGKKLPVPSDLDAPGLLDSQYDRLSVAYGLSYDPFDIGDIIKMDETEDLTDNIITNPVSGSTHTCAKCNGTGGLHISCDACGGSGFVSIN